MKAEEDYQHWDIPSEADELHEYSMLAYGTPLAFKLNDKTIETLESIVNEYEKTLYSKGENGIKMVSLLVADVNGVMLADEQAYAEGWDIENQAALKALLKAFEELGKNGQRTLIKKYVQNAGLWKFKFRHPFREPPDPSIFSNTIETLVRGKTKGPGRPKDHPDNVKKEWVVRICHDLFVELDMIPKTQWSNESGHFARFVKTILNDPVVKAKTGGFPIDHVKKLIQKVIKKG